MIRLIIKQLESDLTRYMTYIYELFQSAYKANHSTETPLVKVQNDVLRALDGQQSVILLLLDLYAPFDTVDHAILLTRLSQRFLIKVLVFAVSI